MAVQSPYNFMESIAATRENGHIPIGTSAARSLIRSTTGVLLQVVDRGTDGSAGETELTLWRSTDGGSSWSFLTQLESGSTDDYGFSLYHDPSNNNVYLAWCDKSSTLATGHELNFKKLTWDGGNSTWTVGSTVVIADSSSTFAIFSEPAIVKDADGDLFVAIQFRTDVSSTFNVRSYYSTDEGANWSQSVASHTTDKANALTQGLMMEKNSSKVLLIYEDYLGNVYSYKRNNSDGQTTWGSEVSISTSILNSPSLVVDSDGNFFMFGFVSTNDVIKYIKYTSSSDTWGSDTTVATPAADNTVQGVQASVKGTLHYVVWSEKKKGFEANSSVDPAYLWYTIGDGSTYASPVRITPPRSMWDWVRVWVYDATSGKYYNRTAEANNDTTGDVISPDSGFTLNAVGDILYLGLDDLTEYQRAIYVPYLASQSESGGAKQWEYWDGSAWSSISGSSLNAPFSSSAGYISLSDAVDGGYPNDWAKTTVNGYNAYYVRLRVTTAHTTGSKASQLTPAHPLMYPHVPATLQTGDTTLPISCAEDTFSASPQKFDTFCTSVSTAYEVLSNTAGQIDISKVIWGEWSDSASFEVAVTTEANSTTAGRLDLEAVKKSNTAGLLNLEAIVKSTTAGTLDLEGVGKNPTAGRIDLESVTKSTTAGQIILETFDVRQTSAGLITLEAVQKNTTAGLINLEAIGKNTTAGQIVLEGIAKNCTAGTIVLETFDVRSTTAGQIITEATGTNTTAGSINLEGLGRNTTAGTLDLEAIAKNTTAGLIETQLEAKHTSAGQIVLESVSKDCTAGQIDLFRQDTLHTSAGMILLEAIKLSTSAGTIDVEAHKLSTSAGRVDLEAIARSVTAGRIDLEGIFKSITAGLITLERVVLSTTSGQIFLEAHKLSTIAGQIDMIGERKSTTAGRIDAETVGRSTSAGQIDIAERVSGQVVGRVDRMKAEGYTRPIPPVGITSPTSPKGFVSPLQNNSGSSKPFVPKGYRKT